MWLAAHLALIALLTVPSYARGADQAICRDFENKFETSKSGITAIGLNAMLFNAADKGCEGLARRLLATGASLHARDRDGAMALARAARAGHATLVATFLDLGAPIDARNIAGSTPLYVATERDRLSVVRLMIAAENGHVAVVEALIRGGAD
jgi:ankyrin repeat protein